MSRPDAQAARRATRAEPVSIRPMVMAMSGSRTKATAVPMRPAATAPMATGSSAYVTAIHARAVSADVMRRAARNAVSPAAGTHPNRSTSVATQGLPRNRVDSAAISPRYGGALAAEPMPASW